MTATLMVESGEEESPRPEGAPPPKVDPSEADLAAELRSPSVRDEVLAMTGQPRSSEMSVREEGRMIALTASAPSREGALALCTTWVRVASGRFGHDESTDYFVLEKARLERELLELSKSMTRLPKASPVSGLREVALTSVRIARVQIDLGESTMLVALRGMLRLARVADDEQGHRGLGAAHPERLKTAARIAAIEAEITRQISVERAESARVEALLLALPPKSSAQVTGVALSERLKRLAIDHVASIDPRELQDLALAHVELRVESAALAVRLGEAHPRRRELEGHTRNIVATFEHEREIAAMFSERGAASTLDERRAEIDDRARRLAIALARLDSWANARRPARVSTVTSCHPVTP